MTWSNGVGGRDPGFRRVTYKRRSSNGNAVATFDVSCGFGGRRYFTEKLPRTIVSACFNSHTVRHHKGATEKIFYRPRVFRSPSFDLHCEALKLLNPAF